ncbi:helix-turn-helix transcriptional regulator [Nocardioides sp. TF02-7]|uniref:helix-turn-helix domain-containing protein n=1 Tax=Nocardioides sp. TF02-7 TaxID=2917724 RepID=UPI001F0550B4|nr:helix-turn-helix transcriptional regulator [Nocardioides sp. TF02-7]UMG93613.1 helix-turn-helix domain-containing protein [Nocardioides sp. TF02-7]
MEEFVDIAERGTVVEWRHHLSMVVAGPWSPYSYRLVELARELGPHLERVVADVIELCRELSKERERELVAKEIRSLVALSGVTQREFAEWLGTSPSRLSTYVSGAVTPSAALLLRMKRTSLALQRRGEARDAAPTRPVLLSVPCGDDRTARVADHATG